MTEIASAVWHQIIVTDPEGLSGASVAKFVGPIIRKLGATAVVALDLIGACPGLMGYEKEALVPDEFLRKVGNATQYDWAFFLLYSRMPTSKDLADDDKAAMLSAEATIRLADDHYFYVYTRDEKLVSELRREYPAAEYKTSSFGKLDIPY